MPNLVLTRGIPASGKTTWARTWVSENPDKRTRINRDDTRKLMFDSYVLNGAQEDAVTAAQHSAVRGLLSAGWDVVVDDTNLSARTVKQWQKLAARLNTFVLFMDFNVDVEECVRRNATREKAVDESVIRRFHARYIKNGKLPVPPKPVDAPDIEPYVPNRLKPRAWLFDIDGTLAHMNGRGPYEWHRVGEDTVDESVSRALRIINSSDIGDDNHPDLVIVMSGRDASCRRQTEEWLARHGIDYHALHMRAANDMRPDNVIKLELFNKFLRYDYWVQGVYDDRDQVVEMWRKLGIPCFQVAPGDF